MWAFANYSRFIRPGAIRIGASSANSSLEVTAFRNLNGSIAVVALNTAATSQAAAFSLSPALLRFDAMPYLTDATDDVVQQPALG